MLKTLLVVIAHIVLGLLEIALIITGTLSIVTIVYALVGK